MRRKILVSQFGGALHTFFRRRPRPEVRRYFEALEILMQWALDIPDIAIVTAHGTPMIPGEAKRLLNFSPGLRYAHSLWAFALKTEHVKERQTFIQGYLSLMKDLKYQHRDNKKIIEYFHSCGANFIPGTSQDYAKHAALWLFGKMRHHHLFEAREVHRAARATL